MKTVDVNIIINNKVELAQLTIADTCLQFSYKDIDIEAGDDYPFLALRKLRLELEKKGILIAVQGSRKDVYPSGMQMGMRTSGAYIHEIGKTGGEVVNIFDPVVIELVASVEEQTDHHNKWIGSIR